MFLVLSCFISQSPRDWALCCRVAGRAATQGEDGAPHPAICQDSFLLGLIFASRCLGPSGPHAAAVPACSIPCICRWLTFPLQLSSRDSGNIISVLLQRQPVQPSDSSAHSTAIWRGASRDLYKNHGDWGNVSLLSVFWNEMWALTDCKSLPCTALFVSLMEGVITIYFLRLSTLWCVCPTVTCLTVVDGNCWQLLSDLSTSPANSLLPFCSTKISTGTATWNISHWRWLVKAPEMSVSKLRVLPQLVFPLT